MKKRDNMIKGNILGMRIYLVIIVVFFLLGLLIGSSFNLKSSKKDILSDKFVLTEGERYVSIDIPAVDNNNKGVSTTLYVVVKPGTGKVLVDIDDLLYWADTQDSIRIAKEVAQNYTKLDLNMYDISYKVKANASLIGGPSAGAAITVATIAALQNKSLRQEVGITGIINHDGTIGPVGGITSKARASKEIGAKLFLVPLLQSREVTYEERKYCRNMGFAEFCTIEQIPIRINVQDESGIEVKEVENINDAMNYFYNDNIQ
jgi:uncharacterized protein